MNRLIMKYAYPVTGLILAIFLWVIVQRFLQGGITNLVVLLITAAIVWALATAAFVWFWPRITVGGFKRMILRRGFGEGPIPLNSLYAVPDLPSQTGLAGGPLATGTDDLVYLGGWLDLRAGPLLLSVPAMPGRYYSLQFTDPASGGNFAYVGTRTTGTAPGSYLLCRESWQGEIPDGSTRIDVPHRSSLVIGRVFTENQADRQAAYSLARQFHLSRFSSPSPHSPLAG